MTGLNIIIQHVNEEGEEEEEGREEEEGEEEEFSKDATPIKLQ